MNNEAGYGRRLRIAREAAGLSVNEVADRLRLKVKVVLSLELENQGNELAPAFIRGYLRNYSQLVGENTEEIVQLYNQSAGNDPALIQLDNIESKKLGSGAMIRWAGALSLIVILLLASAIWWQKYFLPRPDTGSAALPQLADEIPTAEPQPYDALSDSRVSESDTEQSTQVQTEQMHQVAELTAADEWENLPETVEQILQEDDEGGQLAENTEQYDVDVVGLPDIDENEVNPIAPEGIDKLELTFTGISWIEVVDAQDYRLIYGLFDETNNTLSVQGSAPFQVIVGDANVVEISVNDQIYELRRHRRSNNTARVLLGDRNSTTD